GVLVKRLRRLLGDWEAPFEASAKFLVGRNGAVETRMSRYSGMQAVGSVEVRNRSRHVISILNHPSTLSYSVGTESGTMSEGDWDKEGLVSLKPGGSVKFEVLLEPRMANP